MRKFRGTYMNREEYIEWLISNMKFNARLFTEAHYPELKEYFSDVIHSIQLELVDLGYTWEQVGQIELEVYKTA